MRAIIETGGMQFPVEEESIIRVPRIKAEVGQKHDFDRVLLISSPEKFLMGKPYIDGARVESEIVAHGRADKVIVFKFKRRRKYRKKTGHRQSYTEFKILKISA
jgi:large subunit ribosomal protein L21